MGSDCTDHSKATRSTHSSFLGRFYVEKAGRTFHQEIGVFVADVCMCSMLSWLVLKEIGDYVTN